MRYQKSIRYLFISFTLFMVLTLTACNMPLAQQRATPTPNTYGGDGIQKGPGSAALTATALATPMPVVCQTPPLTTPANTPGWQTYTDGKYPFHFSFPPDWKVGQIIINPAGNPSSYYEVLVLPPTSRIPINDHSDTAEPESVRLTIVLTGPVDSFSNDSTWTPETTPFLLSRTRTKLSHRFSPDCGEFNRGTDPVEFGHLPYFFYLESRGQADKIKDSEIFLSIIQSFVYTGN